MNREIVKYLGSRFVPAIVNMAVIVLAIRFLGPAEYARYSLILYSALLVITLSFHWVQVSILKFLGGMPRETGVVMSRFFDLTILSAVLSTLVILAVGIWYFHLPLLELILVGLFAFLTHFCLFHQAVLQAYNRLVRTAILEGSDQLIIMVVLLVGLFVFQWKSAALLFSSLVIGLAGVLLLRIMIRVKGLLTIDLKHIYWDARFSAKVMEYGYGITLWLFLSHLLMAVDRFTLMEVAGWQEAGTYSAVKDLLFKGITFASFPIYISYQAKVMNHWNSRHRQGAWDSVREALSFELLVFIVVFIFFMVVKEALFGNILQIPEADSWPVYLPLILGAFIWQAAMMLQRFVELSYRQLVTLGAIVGVVAVNSVLNVIFVPVYGMMASSFSLLISSILYTVVIAFLSWRAGRLNSEKP